MPIYILLAFLISFVSTKGTIILAKKFNIVTDSKSNTHPAHTHDGVLPRGGGIPVFLGIFLPLIYFVLTNKLMFFVFLGGLATTVVGIIDDKYDISPYIRFSVNVLIAIVAVLGGVGIPFITNPLGSVIHLDFLRYTISLFGMQFHILLLADIAAVLWIVWCMNMVNWSKGVDGQLPGFVFVSAFFLAILAFRFSRHDISKDTITFLGFATAFSYLGFLPWNIYPQKILPGYGAGSLAGYMLAILSILSWGKVGTLLLVIVLPFTDAVIVILRRLAAHKSPFRADKGHFHHTLLDMGWSKRRIAVFYWIISLITGFFSLIMNSQTKLFALVTLICLFAAIVLWSTRFVHSLQNKKDSV